MKVQFANGKIFEAKDIDDAIFQCLGGGDDPFNPVVLQDKPHEKIVKNADSSEQ